MVLLYGLVDPTTLDLRYVGMTRRFKRRVREHKTAATKDSDRRFHSKVSEWIRGLSAVGASPVAVVLESEFSSVGDVRKAEIHWIAILRALGSQLLNVADGGFGGVTHESTRAKISAANRGRVHTAKSRAANSAAQLRAQGRPDLRTRHSQNTKRWLAQHPEFKEVAAEIGRRPKTGEHKAKIAAATRMSMTAERRAANSSALIGRKHTDEARKKISEAARRRPRAALSDEGRRRRSAAVKAALAKKRALVLPGGIEALRSAL